MATELIKGKTLEEAWSLTNEAVAEALEGLPPGKLECSVLSKEAVHSAINEYRKKQGLEPSLSRPDQRNKNDFYLYSVKDFVNPKLTTHILIAY